MELPFWRIWLRSEDGISWLNINGGSPVWDENGDEATMFTNKEDAEALAAVRRKKLLMGSIGVALVMINPYKEDEDD